MSRVYISIGSNIEREHHINQGLDALESLFGNLVSSPVFESESVGFDGSPFYNLVVQADTELTVHQVVGSLKRIESENGRQPNARKFSPRTLDLDLLTYDDLIIDHPAQLPRAEITQNAFVLWPLALIAPDVILPGTEVSYLQLWQNYDRSKQRLWEVAFNRKYA